MKSLKMKKGFTLIELLIVIAIIAILAVAMLPTLLGAPAKGRDTARLANLNSIQKALIYDNLTNSVAFPATAGCAETIVTSAGAVSNLGGKVPKDPTASRTLAGGAAAITTCANGGSYYYKGNPNNAGTVPSGTYSYGLYAVAENASSNTVKCSDAITGVKTTYPAAGAAADSDTCYAILAQ